MSPIECNRTGYARLPQVLAVLPVSRSTFYANVKAGVWPAPVRIGKRVSAWRWQDIDALLKSFEKGDAR